MSFYNDLRMALENDESADVVITDAEQEVVEVEIDAQRDEIERLEEQAEQTEAILSEIDSQNETIRRSVEEGTFTEVGAAGFEAARRMASIALGGDPDSENPNQGRRLVDTAGLESAYSKGIFSLEDNEKEKGKIRQFIEFIVGKLSKAWAFLMEKLSKAASWVTKKLNPLRLVVNRMSDEDIAEGIKTFVEQEGAMTGSVKDLFIGAKGDLFTPGSLKDFQKEVNTFLKESNAATKSLIAAVKSNSVETIDKAVDVAFGGAKLFGKPVFVKSAEGKYEPNPEVHALLNPSKDASKEVLLKLGKADILAITELSLKEGAANAFNTMRTNSLQKDIQALTMAKYDDKETGDAVKKAVSSVQQYVNFRSRVFATIARVDSAYTKLFTAIVNTKPKKEEKAEK